MRGRLLRQLLPGLNFTELCSLQPLLGAPHSLEDVSAQHSHRKVYVWLQIELPLFRFGVGRRGRPSQCVAAASPGCLPNSKETIGRAVLSYLGACLTRLEVSIGTPAPPCTPNLLRVIKTQLLFLEEIHSSLPTSFFPLREDEGYKESQNRL